MLRHESRRLHVYVLASSLKQNCLGSSTHYFTDSYTTAIVLKTAKMNQLIIISITHSQTVNYIKRQLEGLFPDSQTLSRQTNASIIFNGNRLAKAFLI